MIRPLTAFLVTFFFELGLFVLKICKLFMNHLFEQSIKKICVTAVFIITLAGVARAQYFRIEYPASKVAGTLQLAVTYTIWMPEGASRLRGIIVHQHGAGVVAAKSGENAAYDLHWQALAKKWKCALLSPSYHVLNDRTDASPGGAQLWFDPRLGSEKAFLKAISDFAVKSKHPELENVPWVLWGHSGGAIWSDIMSILYPERIAALFLRSGAADMWQGKTGFENFTISSAAYQIPAMCNSGIQEKDNPIGQGQLSRVRTYRAKGAPVSFSLDPLTGHWTGNSRYLAIPYLDACLALRLPEEGSKDQTLKIIDPDIGWLASFEGGKAVPVSLYNGDHNDAIWLPNARIANLWEEYVKTGSVTDSTPPPAPFNVKVSDLANGSTEVTWEAEADFESGIRNFIVLRDGQELGNLPAVNLVRFMVLPMFQAGWTESYNDAPAVNIPEMKFVDPWPKDNQRHSYTVIEVNTTGLRSKASAPGKVVKYSSNTVCRVQNKSDSLKQKGVIVPFRSNAMSSLEDWEKKFSEFKSMVYCTGENKLPFRFYSPAGRENGKRYPLVIFLHGAGEKGNDNRKQLMRFNTVPFWSKYPCFIIAPQCPDKGQVEKEEDAAWVHTSFGAIQHQMKAEPTWPLRLVMALLDKIIAENSVDQTRIYVTGLSMGGFATWELLQREPVGKFAAAIPVSGGADLTYASKFVHLPVWVFHGSADSIVLTRRSRDIVSAIKAAGGSPEYTEYYGVGHDAWTQTYQNPAVWDWLFTQKRK